MSSWLDSCFATPVVGVHFRHAWHFYLQGGTLLVPFIDDLEEGGAKVRLSKGVNPPVTVVDCGDGFFHQLEPSAASVRFEYEPQRYRPAGGLETHRPGELRPYTELLDDVLAKLEKFVDRLNSGGRPPLEAERLGIVAISHLVRGKEPPGVTDLIDHLGAPWPSGALRSVDSNLIAELDRRDGHFDQCHHRVNFDVTAADEQKDELRLHLDWQRHYDAGRPTVKGGGLKKALEECKKTALQYFEDLGEGLDGLRVESRV